MATQGAKRTRQEVGLMNLLKQGTRLEMRSNFFSIRAVEDRNCMMQDIKITHTASHFKRLYNNH
jgi:hypothetical protein